MPRYADAYSRLFSFAFFTRVDAAFFKKYRLHIVSISQSKISQKLKPTLMGWVSLLINRFFRSLAAFSRISVFLLTCAAEKLLVSENRLTSDFQERVGGIGGSRAQSENPLDFRRAAFPPREGRLCRHSRALPNPKDRAGLILLLQTHFRNVLEKGVGKNLFYFTFRKIKKEQPRYFSGIARGDPSGIRTPDTLIKSQVLCQLS